MLVITEVQFGKMLKQLLDRIGRESHIKFEYLSNYREVRQEYRSGEWTYVFDNGFVISLCRWFDAEPNRCETIEGFAPIVTPEDEGRLEAILRERVANLLDDQNE